MIPSHTHMLANKDACLPKMLTLTYKYSAEHEKFTCTSSQQQQNINLGPVDWAKLWKDVFVRPTCVRSAAVGARASCI